MSDQKPLTTRQRRAIAALIDPAHETLAEAAAAAGVPESSLRRWRAVDEAFKSALADAVADLRADVARRLHTAAVRAIGVLNDGMGGDATPTQVRAAELVLKFTLGERLAVEQIGPKSFVILAPPPEADLDAWRAKYTPASAMPAAAMKPLLKPPDDKWKSNGSGSPLH